MYLGLSELGSSDEIVSTKEIERDRGKPIRYRGNLSGMGNRLGVWGTYKAGGIVQNYWENTSGRGNVIGSGGILSVSAGYYWGRGNYRVRGKPIR